MMSRTHCKGGGQGHHLLHHHHHPRRSNRQYHPNRNRRAIGIDRSVHHYHHLRHMNQLPIHQSPHPGLHRYHGPMDSDLQDNSVQLPVLSMGG